MKIDTFIEWDGSKLDHKLLTETAKEIWKAEGNLVKDLTSVKLFFKPQERKCYYVFNSEVKGDFEV